MKSFIQSKKYSEFFASCIADGVRNVCLQGGRRSRKTWSTFDFMYDIAAMLGGQNILVATDQFPPLKKTMQDFEECVGVTIRGSDRYGYHCVTENNTLWQFNYFGSSADAQGSKCDILFVNEAVRMDRRTASTLRQGVRRICFYNFNPTEKSWVQALPDSRTLKTTFHDNPYITDEQREEFERLKERAMRPNANRIDVLQYRVYYLGEFDAIVGRVFPGVERIPYEAYKQIPATETFGMDFGFATDGDPTVLVGCKRWQDKIYFHQYFYEFGLTNDRELGERILSCGLNYATYISADYGGMGKGRIRTLRTADNGHWSGELAHGFSIGNAIKTGIMDGINQLLSEDGIVITEESAAMREEMEEYTIDDNGKPKGVDHALDAGRYAYTYNKRMVA